MGLYIIMNEEQITKHKIIDIANRSYKQNIYTFSNFLSITELSILYSMKKELSFISFDTFGGYDGCERAMVRFGSEELFGYTEDFPITVIKISPLIEKFSEELGHRDYLGALMNLGIKRELLGDIIINNKTAYVLCVEHIANYITDNLNTIKHTHVQCELSNLPQDSQAKKLEDIEIISASPRIDAVVAAITHLSRSQALNYFTSKKIYVNNLCMENNSYQLKCDDILVIRGYGKYIYKGFNKETRKGRVYIQLQHYT